MKKLHLSIFLTITLVFIGFTFGFFLGKNQSPEAVHLSKLPVTAQHDFEPAESNDTSPTTITISFPIDINSAGIDELTALPGIGQTLAQRILNYRKLHGSFERPEELLNVEGIGAGKLESILNYIMTGG